ncbi:hypothetical protein SZ64_10955 [Erythrobacter sp. SG61-1L]|uniref:hypothetical protein n=1 Tax=Erythrobacter sp. SG61-1L TaxID=1603897 RepID=UPI0006C9234E|nr:hypothetical protein [Erythrobacter sp. SG61-1L]KPL68577.1 hypothetical protein SZ64_10955 [Erythrobacter sp. SG61-1L]
MPAFFFALLATFLAATGGRDQRLVAVLAGRLGSGGPLLLAAWLSSIATSTAAAFVGAGLAQLMPPEGKAMFVALALLLGAGELAWPVRQRDPVEPTRSFVAITLVIAARQVMDAARFLIVAFAASAGSPMLAGVGGALGGGAALTLAWALGGQMERRVNWRAIRLSIAAAMLLAAFWTGLSARGIL